MHAIIEPYVSHAQLQAEANFKPMMELNIQIKEALDPNNVANPTRFVNLERQERKRPEARCSTE